MDRPDDCLLVDGARLAVEVLEPLVRSYLVRPRDPAATLPAAAPLASPYPETKVLVAFGATQRQRYDQEILGSVML